MHRSFCRAKQLVLMATLAMACALAHAAELTSVGNGELTVDVCSLNLAKDSLRMFWKGPDGSVLGTFDHVQDVLLESKERLYCASNAGIYGKDLRPLGLYVEDRHVVRRLNPRKEGYGNFYMQPNGVFLVTDRGAALMSTDDVQSTWDALAPSLRFATQSGPLMLQAGRINSLFTPGSPNRVVRNAVCVKSATELALVKSRYPINFYDFAQVMRDALGCRDALYLDGSVSELYPFGQGGLGPRFGVMIGVVVPLK